MTSPRPPPSRLPRAGLLAACLLLAGCGQHAPSPAGPRLRLRHALWEDGVALALVAGEVAERHLGYRVEIRQTGLEEGLAEVAGDEADAFLALWLPETNQSQIQRFGPDLADMGPAVTGARAGLVGPIDLPVESIAELDRISDDLGGVILSIEAEAGMGRETQQAVKAYGLDLEVRHLGTEPMLAALQEALAAGRPVVASGWKPHWMFSRFRLKFLADPKGVFGVEERLHPVASTTLEERQPRAAALLRALSFDEVRFDSLLAALNGAQDPRRATRRWLAGEAALVERWLEEVPPAASVGP